MGKLRDRMPHIDAFIDQLRGVFGREAIDRAIVEGMESGTFHARENGHEVGMPINPARDAGVILKNCSPWNDKET